MDLSLNNLQKPKQKTQTKNKKKITYLDMLLKKATKPLSH